MKTFVDQLTERKESDKKAINFAYQNLIDSVSGNYNPKVHNGKQRELDSICIKQIFNYFKFKRHEANFAAELFVLSKGKYSDINKRLTLTLRECNIVQKKINLDKDFPKYAYLPVLARTKKDNELVTLLPHKSNGYYYINFFGKKKKITPESFDELEQEAYVFYRTFPNKKISVKDLFSLIFCTVNIYDVGCYLALGGIVALLGTLSPKLTNILFSEVIEYSAYQLLVAVFILSLCIAIGASLIGTFVSLILSRISTKISNTVQAATIIRLFSLSPQFFQDNNSGKIASLANQITYLSISYLQLILTSGLTSIFAIVYVYQLFYYSIFLALPGLIVVVAQIIVAILTVKYQNSYFEQKVTLNAECNNTEYEILRAIQKIRLTGSEDRMFSIWGNVFARRSACAFNPPFIIKFGGVITTVASLLMTIVLYYLAVQTKISIADYTSFNVVLGLVTGAASTLISTASSTSGLYGVLNAVKLIFDQPPEYDPKNKINIDIKGSIKISNLSFRYDKTTPMILNNISFDVEAGEYIAIVGKTGCGKTTLEKLILGFLTPTQGAVYYDNENLVDLDKMLVRQNIGTVLQDAKLVYGDILSNIKIANPELSDSQVWHALKKAQIAEDIKAMPMGIHTLVGEGIKAISGGQKQRLLIARAIAGNPKILILDEATSSLDNKTQAKISDTLDKLNCTRIVIAHRLSTIKLCDRILVLQDGKIVEDGKYDELIQNNGYFKKLVESQQC